ncbi:MAG TPA: hypothetical protein DIT08_01970 [Enterococcus sp.]|nr:hypothetical protein [Enterococcus sp.]
MLLFSRFKNMIYIGVSSMLSNKTIVVTGGTSGIGYDSVKLFLENGANVVVIGRSEKKLQQLVADFPQFAKQIQTVLMDMENTEELLTIGDKLGERNLTIDGIFANAGIYESPELSDVEPADFDKLFNVNIKAPFFLIQKLLPLMNPRSSIVMTSSAAQALGHPGTPLYLATKAGIRSLARSIGGEKIVLDKGVRVNTLSPGVTRTSMTSNVETGEVDEGLKDIITNKIPLGRIGETNEIAQGALFLLSDNSSYITGTDLVMDGGLSQI